MEPMQDKMCKLDRAKRFRRHEPAYFYLYSVLKQIKCI